MYLTRKLKLGKTEQLDGLAERAGALWSRVAKWHWRFVRRQGHWASKPAMQRWLCKGYEGLHSQSAQAVADSFYDALASWRSKRKTYPQAKPSAKPPHKQKQFFKAVWKSSAIRVRQSEADGKLRLSNGRGADPLVIRWQWPEPKRIEIGWDGEQYELRAQFKNLTVTSKQLSQTLSRLGVSAPKSKRRFPSIPRELSCYFVRGYFDGDGCISVRESKNRRHIALNIASTADELLRDMKRVVEDETTLPLTLNESKPSGCWYLRMYGSERIAVFGKWMYQNGSRYLSRKRRKFKQI